MASPHYGRGDCARISPELCPTAFKSSSSGQLTVPSVFTWLQRLGEVEPARNGSGVQPGIGMVLVVSPFYAESIRISLKQCGISTWQIGPRRKRPASGFGGKVREKLFLPEFALMRDRGASTFCSAYIRRER